MLVKDMTAPVSELRRQFAIDVLRKLREAGFEAYWAGGCVRDHLLGLAPKDFDVATNATPEQVRTLFGRRRTLAVGAAFGVIVVVGPTDVGQVEVTTFRHDGRYSDGRHPDHVTFGTAEEDVRRRDFTINGMLFDPIEQRVLDWVGGQDDLCAGVVRAIGDPRQRFDEDKLRMLRAVRFAARFNFRLDDVTSAAVRDMAAQIAIVSAERIAQEMRAILVHPSRAAGVELCREVGLLAVVLPEVGSLESWRSHETCGPNVWQHTLEVLGRLHEPSFPLALGALLHAASAAPGESGAVAEAVSRRWRLSNEEMDRALWLVRHHRDLREASTMPWPRLQRILITDGIHELLDLHEADLAAIGRSIEPIIFCRELLRKPRQKLDPAPLITGHDLIRHGVPRGKVYQALLDRVRDAQLEGRTHDAPGALALVDQLLAGGEVQPSPHVWRD
jgi:tRNA nucleotidyltransferase/poly(A) polymerase